MVGIAQLVRAPGCGPGGQGFESLYSPHTGVSPSGKARDFDFRIRKFESCYPCHITNSFVVFLRQSSYLGVSPSGKATDSDSVIPKVRIFLPLPNNKRPRGVFCLTKSAKASTAPTNGTIHVKVHKSALLLYFCNDFGSEFARRSALAKARPRVPRAIFLPILAVWGVDLGSFYEIAIFI